MKGDSQPMMICLRPGESVRGKLSARGMQQLQSLKIQIENILQHVYGAGEMRRLLMSFSYQNAALASIQRLRNPREDCLVKDWPFMQREDIVAQGNLTKIWRDVLAAASQVNAPVVVIVAHGSMPLLLAEIAYTQSTGKRISLEIYDNTDSGSGYCVIPQTQQVIHFSLLGPMVIVS